MHNTTIANDGYILHQHSQLKKTKDGNTVMEPTQETRRVYQKAMPY